jgi:hypothetical protein
MSENAETKEGINFPLDTSRLDIAKARQQYAWAWFEFHAKQRTTVFNYFLLAASLVITAYATLMKDGWYPLAALVSAVGAAAAIGFLGLEFRNTQLVGWGERMLVQSERNFLFAQIKMAAIPATMFELGDLPNWRYTGILSVEEDTCDGEVDRFRDDGVYVRDRGKWKYKLPVSTDGLLMPISHGYWFPRMIVGAFCVFLLLCMIAVVTWLASLR